MTDEPMVPLYVPESVVRAAVPTMNVPAETYRKAARNCHTSIVRLSYLARAAAIEWVETNPEREWVTRDTPLHVKVAHDDLSIDIDRWLIGWTREGQIGAQGRNGAIRWYDPDGWYVVRDASASGDLERGGRR